MEKQRKAKIVEDIKRSVNTPKDKLISAMYELMEAGAIREAKSLETIIIKLETWQNK